MTALCACLLIRAGFEFLRVRAEPSFQSASRVESSFPIVSRVESSRVKPCLKTLAKKDVFGIYLKKYFWRSFEGEKNSFLLGKTQFSGSRASFRVSSWFEPAILDASLRVDEFEPNSDPALLLIMLELIAGFAIHVTLQVQSYHLKYCLHWKGGEQCGKNIQWNFVRPRLKITKKNSTTILVPSC